MADIHGVNLNLLLVFDALLSTRSVTRTAERLGLTQSGASNALAQLRLVFDDPLFERQGHTMQPTARALEVADDVRAGIAALRRALAPRRFEPEQLTRQFVLAMPDAIQLVLLPPLLASMAEQAPGARLRVLTWAEQRVPEGLANREIDLFAGFASHCPPEHVVAVLYDDTYVILARRGHPALREGSLELQAWLSAGHVVVSREADGPTGIDRALADRGLARIVALRLDHALLVPWVVAQTDLLAAVDRRWASLAIRQGGLSEALEMVEPPLPLPRGRVRLFWHRRAETDPAARWLRELVLEAIQGKPPPVPGEDD